MNTIDRTSTLTWLALSALTLLGFGVSESWGGRGAILAILCAAAVKASLVGFQFMGLRSAHAAWKVAFAGMLAFAVLVLGVIFGLAASAPLALAERAS